ncbi:TonB-dependent receptor [Sphingomonas morindae]|uniref:TonB-dependent receptor n=1 Tax=Sphingomonas morindae TaxID=1541170 RepID=A0ABY4XF55_9SPHN|nr:TonB-dependent receptor [Sphingomonas morindae]USI75231.1 TonB-dependent receptor [Sphingomonas morindae]
MVSLKGMLAAGTMSVCCLAEPALAQSMWFHVGEQAAVSGIPEFARQAKVQIVSPAGLNGVRTQAVNGSYSVDDGLRMLLRGTGLRVTMRSGNVISLGAEPVATPVAVRQVRPSPAPVAPPAQTTAEAAPPEEMNEIIVSGTRRRISPSPQEEKKNSISFVSTVGTEELAKRTDVNVVSALERLPGVVLQRGSFTGQSAYPAIRGFNGWYNSVTLDGGTFYTSTRNQRGTTLDFLPVAVINELVVSKTVTPDMDPNSIGGHIDIRTLRSFDNDGRPETMLNGEGTFYSYHGLHNGNPSYLLNGVIKRTFGPDNNFGFVLAASTHKDRSDEKYNTTTTFLQTNGVDVASGALQTGDYQIHSHGFSLLGKLEARGDNFYGYISGNYFKDDAERDQVRSIVSIAPALVTNAGEGTGNFTGATPRALSNPYFLDRRIWGVRGGLEYQTNENSKIVANASYLNTSFYEQLWTSGNIIGPAASGSYNVNSSQAGVSLTGPASLNDPIQWIQAGGTTATQTKWPLPTTIVTGRLEYRSNNFDFSHGFGYDFGVDFRQMWRQLKSFNVNYTLPTGQTITLNQVLDPDAAFNGSDPSSAVFVNQDAYWNLVSKLGSQTIVDAPTSNYKLNENVTAPFAAVYYTTDRFRILAGVRYNITHFTDRVSTITNGVVAPFFNKKTYPYLLPNVQGYYNLTDSLRLRAAYTETTALQNYNDFAQGITTNYDGKGNLVTQGSNPNIKPRRSYNEDASIEYYGRRGYVSLGYFHKTVVDESQGVTTFVYNTAGQITAQIGTPLNGGGEHSQGLEVEGQWRDFSRLSPFLKGVDLAINGAWFDSDTEFLTGNNFARRVNALRQQPKWVANLIINYVTGPFNASAVVTSRGRAFSGFNANPALDVYIDPFTTLGLRAGYSLNRTTNLYIEGRNITNYTYKEVYGLNKNLVSTSIKTGPIFVIGATIRL